MSRLSWDTPPAMTGAVTGLERVPAFGPRVGKEAVASTVAYDGEGAEQDLTEGPSDFDCANFSYPGMAKPQQRSQTPEA